MKSKLTAIALLICGVSCLTLVSCDQKKNDAQGQNDTLTVQHNEVGSSDTVVVEHDVKVEVDTTHHDH